MAKYLASVDCGSTGIKGYIWTTQGEVVAKSYAKVVNRYGPNGEVEEDPEEIFQTVVTVLKQVMHDAKITATDIISLGITTQRSTFISWDVETSRPCHPLISWMDLRAARDTIERNKAPIVKALRVVTTLLYWVTRDPHYQAASNYRFSTLQAILKVAWVWQHLPVLKELQKQNRLRIGTLDTWLLWKLSAGKIYATDHSNAVATGFYDPFDQTWSWMLWFLAPLPPRHIFPKLMSTSDKFRHTDPSIFGAPIAIGAVVADQSAALFGQGCFTRGDVKCTLGTGGFLSVVLGSKCGYSPQGLYPIASWKIGDKVTYNFEGNFQCAGSVLDWMESVDLSSLNDAAELAQQVEDSGDTYFVPSFSGHQVPLWDARARGLMIGLNQETKREHIVRAILESIGYSVARIADVIAQDTALRVQTIRLDGGVSRGDFVCQALADLTGAVVERPRTAVDMTAWGAAALAGLSAGVYKDIGEIAALRKIDRVFKPQLPESERRRRLERFYNAAPRAGQWREDDRLEVRHTHERMSLGAALAWLIIGVLIGIGATVYTVGLWYPRQ
jgi:glycerol kinase